jgi:hypothetical protein
MMNVTRSQAAAFVDSLTGWIDLSEDNGTPKSPHALTHLNAVLGLGRVPGVQDVIRANEGAAFKSSFDKVNNLADFLEGVVKALREVKS